MSSTGFKLGSRKDKAYFYFFTENLMLSLQLCYFEGGERLTPCQL